MRYLVISDIHGNVTALDTVLSAADGQFDKIWCLGDIVGYGPNPNECIERITSYDHAAIAGNHDWAVLDKLDVDEFNLNARFAVLWTQDRLTPEHRAYLDNLPLYLIEDEIFTLVHGSPRHPIWEYILYPKVAQLNFNHFETPYCFVGHTHSPVVYVETQSTDETRTIIPETDTFVQPLNTERLIINPGSIGQPRDGDARASYGILDTETMQFTIKRVTYDVEAVQKIMQDFDFPAKLWNRLAFGY